jgi:hypothetical protein
MTKSNPYASHASSWMKERELTTKYDLFSFYLLRASATISLIASLYCVNNFGWFSLFHALEFLFWAPFVLLAMVRWLLSNRPRVSALLIAVLATSVSILELLLLFNTNWWSTTRSLAAFFTSELALMSFCSLFWCLHGLIEWIFLFSRSFSESTNKRQLSSND